MRFDIDDDLPEAQRTLPAIWRRRALRSPAEPFLWFAGAAARTAQVLDSEVAGVAIAVRRLGVERGDRVCVLMKNSPEMIAVMLGLWEAGAVVVPISAQMIGALLADQVSRARAVLAVADDDLAGGLGGASLPVVAKSRLMADASAAATGRHDSGRSASGVSFTDPALILYTSGSTGPSKGCLLSHHFCVYYAWTFWRYMRYRDDDTIYSCLPLNHVHALFASFFPAVLAGGRYSFSERFSASHYWQHIADSGATTCSAIGPMASILLKQPPCEAEGRLRLRLAHIAPAPPGVEAFQRRFRLRVASTLYGMSEAMIFPADPDREPVTGVIGTAPADWDVAIVDDLGRELPAGEPGELVARPRRPLILFDGYFDMPGETVKAWRGLWYHTGDVCRRDVDGVYWFMGRLQDQIRHRGENVSAWELESLLGAHPHVAEIAAVSTAAESGDDELVVFARAGAGTTLGAEELREFAERVLPRFARPDRIVIVQSELPRTGSGKIDKRELRSRLGATAPDRRQT